LSASAALRPRQAGLDRLLKDATARKINIIAAWSVDRLGRSLQDLVGFLTELQALRCDLYLHHKRSTPARLRAAHVSDVRHLWRIRAPVRRHGNPENSSQARTRYIRRSACADGYLTVAVPSLSHFDLRI
jgi:hypothetical protein